MVQNNVSQVGEGSENPEKELGALSEMPNRAKITTSFRDFKYRRGLALEMLEKKFKKL